MPVEPFYGQIMMWPSNFAPRGWAFCDGQILSIMQNTPLFALLGNTYGGDARTTFALPDLRGRAPMHQGAGPGLTLRDFGEIGGAEQITLPTGTLTEAPAGDPAQQVVAAPSDGTIANLPPYQTINFVIALDGVWPTRP